MLGSPFFGNSHIEDQKIAAYLQDIKDANDFIEQALLASCPNTSKRTSTKGQNMSRII